MNTDIMQFIFNFREILLNTINFLLPPTENALVSGMLLGQHSKMSFDFVNNMRETGTIHVVVVSGYNFTILSNFIFKLLEAFIKDKYIKLLLTYIVLYIYIILVGFDAPVIRSFIMTFVSICALTFGRPIIALYSLALSAFLMLIININLINDMSFQLSFMATLGLILFSNSLKEMFLKIYEKLLFKIKYLNKSLSNIPQELIFGDLASTISATLMVWPLISLNFGEVSLISPLVNILILWTIPYIMILSTLAILISFIFPLISYLFTLLCFFILQYFIGVINFFGSLSFSSIQFKLNLISSLIYYILIAYFYLLIRKL